MLGLTPPQAGLVFLLLVTPICIWVIYTDLKYMKIRNTAVMALVAIYAIAGPLVLPLDVWAWRLLHLVVVLAVGVFLNVVAHFGAGDAKVAAAAAPFFSASAAGLVIVLLAAFLLGAFAAHRIFRAIPAVRRMTPDWVSWTRADFPLGLALVGTLWTYLLIVVLP